MSVQKCMQRNSICLTIRSYFALIDLTNNELEYIFLYNILLFFYANTIVEEYVLRYSFIKLHDLIRNYILKIIVEVRLKCDIEAKTQKQNVMK